MSLGQLGGETGGVFGGDRLFVGVGLALESVERKRTNKMRMVEESLVREAMACETLWRSLVKDWLFFNKRDGAPFIGILGVVFCGKQQECQGKSYLCIRTGRVFY